MLNEILSRNDALDRKTEQKGLSSSALWAQLWRKIYYLERNTEQNPEQLLLANISENGFLYISTTHASLFLIYCVSLLIQRDYLTAIWCVSRIKGRKVFQVLYGITYIHTYKNFFVFDGNQPVKCHIFALALHQRFHTARDSYKCVLNQLMKNEVLVMKGTNFKAKCTHLNENKIASCR